MEELSKMTLYHGSNIEIKQIDLSKGRPQKDFGKGFYTTPLLDQAQFWSRRIANRFGGDPIISKFFFRFNEAKQSGLDIKIFEKPDIEWAQFVMENRNIRGQHKHIFDIVIGPVADDDIATLFGLYDMKVIDLQTLARGLEYKKLTSQYFFATEKALEFLIAVD